MTTEVIITGTGNPIISPGRAGPGACVRDGDTTLQFDAGQSTALRLIEAGVKLADITALFVTHHHSDHITGSPELVIGRQLQDPTADPGSLPVIAPKGFATEYLARMLEPMDAELTERAKLPRVEYPSIELDAFDASGDLSQFTWTFGELIVTTFLVVHGHIEPSVGFKVVSPDGTIVISGDTSVCEALEAAAAGADVLVNEVVCTSAADEMEPNFPPMKKIRTLHSESTELGAMAQRCSVKKLVLTHLIPPPLPTDEPAKQRFADDVRTGGFTGEVMVANDLDRIVLG